MLEPEEYSHERYLRAKASVTNRALSRRLWDRFIQCANDISADSVRILDVGGGVGHMALRLWDALTTPHIDYTLVDTSSAALRGAAATFDRLRQVCESEDSHFRAGPESGQTMEIRLIEDDILSHLRSAAATDRYHIVVAQSILDLIPLRPFIQLIKPLLQDKNTVYTPETFNGKTTLFPLFDDQPYENKLIDTYHASMNRQAPEGPTGGSMAGQKMLSILQSGEGARIEGAASSDWIVHSTDGQYPNDEAYFLHHILHFFENELKNHSSIDQRKFQEWINTRRAQIESGVLMYIAHQIDVLIRFE